MPGDGIKSCVNLKLAHAALHHSVNGFSTEPDAVINHPTFALGAHFNPKVMSTVERSGSLKPHSLPHAAGIYHAAAQSALCSTSCVPAINKLGCWVLHVQVASGGEGRPINNCQLAGLCKRQAAAQPGNGAPCDSGGVCGLCPL